MSCGKMLLSVGNVDGESGGHVARNDSYGTNSDDEVELHEVEVLDTEDEGEDDLFKNILRKRAKTEALVTKQDSTKDEILVVKTKRSKTSKDSTNTRNLLEILLPDNIDTSGFPNDFMHLVQSTQLTETSMVTPSNILQGPGLDGSDIDLKKLMENPHGADLQNKDDDGEEIEISKENSGSNSTTKEVEDVEEYSDDDSVELLKAETYSQEVSESKPNESETIEFLRDDTLKKVDNDEILVNDHNVSLYKEKKTSNKVKCEDLPNDKDTKIVKPSTVKPQKVKLSELCTRGNKIRYRVGLSRRANVDHLHSYLTKKS